MSIGCVLELASVLLYFGIGVGLLAVLALCLKEWWDKWLNKPPF